ncbi:uncharacterized protein LAESUDRAFT_728320 [Laetiporus sulphureus 93-53]|uniref:DUF6593 domain-containing protein n=1 Tax=Laetiporus sulphureus 93-53 TaxID=1314785 RepID=A0A165D491_9APHY|nr:uncharacterized protein LAESUDRAFT_728320 [Laetiporus sulphureus 93-53]KZT04123.1 hypothetical protein LAESUDRAFT_728320 [Laetiporus sulphureus 93-53]
MTTFGMPYFLEDLTGELTGSEFNDLYNRTRLAFRCTLHDASHTAYMVYDLSASGNGYNAPVACLDFGANNALGTVKIGDKDNVSMSVYLSKVGSFGSAKTRKFIASDGQEYRWTHKPGDDAEWTCTNTNGYHVASYSLKPAGEPQYPSSSGCMLTVEEQYPHLVAELLASLLIMRHIAKYNL